MKKELSPSDLYKLGTGSTCSWANIFRRLLSKRCTCGSKSSSKSLVCRYQAKLSKTVHEHLKVCHIWLIKFWLCDLNYVNKNITSFFKCFESQIWHTLLQMPGNSFCEFGLVSTYLRFSAAFWHKSAQKCVQSSLKSALQSVCKVRCKVRCKVCESVCKVCAKSAKCVQSALQSVCKVCTKCVQSALQSAVQSVCKVCAKSAKCVANFEIFKCRFITLPVVINLKQKQILNQEIK